MKKSFATCTLMGLSAALLCCCSAPVMGGVMLVDFELPEGVEAGDSLSGSADGASVAKQSSSTDGAEDDASSGGSGASADAGDSAAGSSSSSGGSGAAGSGAGAGGSGSPTASNGSTANGGGSANNGSANSGSTPPVAGPEAGSGNGGIGPDVVVTDPVVLVSQPTGGDDHGPSVSNDPTFSYSPPISIVSNEGGSALPVYAANLSDPEPGASAPEASAVIVWVVLGTTAAFGCKLRRRSGREGAC